MLTICQICINLHTGNTTLHKPHFYVTNDIKLAMDSKKGTILVMIDLSSAFDTIDHSILLSRLELRYGITSVVLEWFRSYLYSRVQRINIDDNFSPPHPLTTGVPQGSVLGPLLFSLYVQPLGKKKNISLNLSYKLCHHELLLCTLYHIPISALNMLY